MNGIIKDVLRVIGVVLKGLFLGVFGIFVFFVKFIFGSVESASSGRNYAVVNQLKAGNRANRQRFKRDEEYRSLRMKNERLRNQILEERKRKLKI